MTLLGNKLDEEITLRGITLWGRDTSLRFDDDSVGDGKNFAEDDLPVAFG